MMRWIFTGLVVLILSLVPACRRSSELPPGSVAKGGGGLLPITISDEVYEQASSKTLLRPAAEAAAPIAETEAEEEEIPEDEQDLAADEEESEEGEFVDQDEPEPEPTRPQPQRQRRKSELEQQMDATPAVPGLLNRG